MGLHLTGKGSILDAIGGALNTGANAVVAGVKDLGDLGSLGVANLTHNQQAAQNARSAISSNDSNLSGQSFPGRAVNDVYDNTALPMYQQVIGDAPSNLSTSPIGTAVKELAATATGNIPAYAHARKAGDVATAAYTKKLPQLAEFAGTEGGIKEAPEDLPKPEVNEKPASTPKEPPAKAQAPADDGGPKITVTSQPSAGDIQVENPVSLPPEPDPTEPPPPEPSPKEMAATKQLFYKDVNAPNIDWEKVGGANQELAQTIQNVAQNLRQRDIMSNQLDGPTDLFKQIRDHGGIGSSDYEDIPNHLKRKNGASMDRVAQEMGYPDDASLHEAIQNEGERRTKEKTPLKSMAEYRELAKDYVEKNPHEFDHVPARAAAENHLKDFLEADKTSGYDKAKWQIPKGAPARKFIQALYDKTHSPEYNARNAVGAKLGDVRNTLKATKTLRDRAQRELDNMTKRKSNASEQDIRTKAAEVRSHATRYNYLKGLEQHHALTYKTLATQLDEKFPEINLSAKKGVRLTSNQQAFETAQPGPVDGRVPFARGDRAGAAEEEALTNRILDGENPSEMTAKTAQGQAYLNNEVRKAGGAVRVSSKQVEDPMDAIRARAAEQPKDTGPNLNKEAFIKDDIAKLEAERAASEAIGNTRESFPVTWQKEGLMTSSKMTDIRRSQIEGDQAILEGIKNGDSDTEIIKAYQEATGADEAMAKKALGVIEDNPNADKVGAIENNPYISGENGHVKIANYNIEPAEPKGAGKVLMRSQAYRNRIGNKLVDKALLRSRGYMDELATKHMLATNLWQKLGPEDQALADNLRNHSIEEVAESAKNPEAFTAYAQQAKDIQDFIHAARAAADPFDATPYRQNYGATLHTAKPGQEPAAFAAPKEGDMHSYQEARHYHSYEEKEADTGEKRTTDNFHHDLTKDVVAAQHNITEHSLLYGLRQAFGDNIASYGGNKLSNHEALHDFNNVFVDRELADRINSRALHHYSTTSLGTLAKGYDTVNKSMKDIKLSLGGFHNINIALSQAAIDAGGLPGASKAFGSTRFFHNELARWDADGTLQKAFHTGLTLGAGPEFGDAASLINRGKYNPVRVAHDALFTRQIPYAKMSTFEKYAKGLDLNNPADYDKMRGISRGINNIYGGINRLVDGFTPKQFKVLSRFVLAADYNEGQIRTLISAVSKGGVEGNMARQMVIGRASILAMPGTVQAIATGQIGNNPEDIAKHVGRQLLDPTFQTNYKTGGGNPKEISGLATVTNKAYRAIAPAFDSNNPDKTSGIKSEATGNLAAAPSLIQAEVNNKDFYGNPLHGKGLSAAEDAGQALNAAAPIPAQPVARVIAGSHFRDNPLVKIASGGQSAITPGEAAVDVSGIGRVKANPDAPVMQIMNHRQQLVQSLKGDEQAQSGVFAVHPGWDQSLSKQHVADKYNDVHYEENKWNALQNPDVVAALKKQNDFAAAHGEPSDPLFSLSPKDQHTILTYKYLTAVDPGSDSNDKAAAIFADNKDMITNYNKDESAYYNAEQQLYQNSGGLKGDPANTPKIVPGGVPYPSILQDPKNQATLDGYTALLQAGADTATKQKYIADHPEVQQMFDASFNYQNARAAALGQPQEKAYPKAPPALESWITQYIAADKAGRKSLRNADMNSFNAMQNYMAQVDEYLLARTAGQAKYQGHDFSQANLKEIYSLGQYDIAKKPGADGNDTYSVDPQAAFAAGGSGGGGGRSGRSGSSKAGMSASQRRESKLSVKYAYHPAKVFIRGKKNPHFQKIQVASAKRPKVNIKAKSVPVV